MIGRIRKNRANRLIDHIEYSLVTYMEYMGTKLYRSAKRVKYQSKGAINWFIFNDQKGWVPMTTGPIKGQCEYSRYKVVHLTTGARYTYDRGILEVDKTHD